MNWKKSLMTLMALSLSTLAGTAVGATLTDQEMLGQEIFFDQNLSVNNNQACAACHAPEAGWTGPDGMINAHGAVYEGSISGRFGNRKPPSSAYATQSPILHLAKQGGGTFVGGNFWDGRATGEKLGNPAADQAQGPFLNPLEQALPDAACVVYRVFDSAYAGLYVQVWGPLPTILWPSDVATVCSQDIGTVMLSDADRALVQMAYDNIALSIAAYEGSPAVNAFSSRYDAFLNGQFNLTSQEKAGLNLFRGKAKCNKCHTLNKGPHGAPPLFTDFTFDNLGIPKNMENPFYSQTAFNPLGLSWLDLGLGGFLQTRLDWASYANGTFGAHKVPTLRNVDKRPSADFVKAFGHNGYFKSLEQIVNFYNTRDVKPACTEPLTADQAMIQGCWPLPEIALNMNTAELGDLGLTTEEEAALVAFLKTLSDGF